ncbi:MAG: tRNA pseudouridine(38-40) synthase TruA [Gemmatimonadaceae bacterium]
MAERTVQLVLHYDGAGFSGWQRQPEQRTVQGVVENALERLCGGSTPALGSGRTDAGVHARGQAVGVRLPERWAGSDGTQKLRRALNALLPPDVWVAAAEDMQPEFHARYSATSRRYSYYVGTDDDARSPFRVRYEWAFPRPIDRTVLEAAAASLTGDHCFRAFAVLGTAPEHDTHRCIVADAIWRDRPGGLVFEIEANRFLHHMVRFLVGTMLDVASRRRPLSDVAGLLLASDNRDVSPPAPPHGLFLDRVVYPRELYAEVGSHI